MFVNDSDLLDTHRQVYIGEIENVQKWSSGICKQPQPQSCNIEVASNHQNKFTATSFQNPKGQLDQHKF